MIEWSYTRSQSIIEFQQERNHESNIDIEIGANILSNLEGLLGRIDDDIRRSSLKW